MKLRQDNDEYRARVEEARDNIYRKGFTINSEPGVERLLKENSLVPTLVSYSIMAHVLNKLMFTPEHIFACSQRLEF
jgi:hypothetical protein